MENLHPGIKKAWILSAIIPSLFISLLGAIFLSAFLRAGFIVGLTMFFVFFAFIFFISLIFVNMAYNRYKFEFRDEGVFIEKGIIFKNYHTIPYSRIQNVDLYRGIFARMFGYSALMIQTAGYSGGYYGGGPMITFGGGRRGRGAGISVPIGGGGAMRHAEGYIPAIETRRAEELRSWLIKRISKQ